MIHFNREDYNEWFTTDHYRPLPCPTCKIGKLELMEEYVEPKEVAAMQNSKKKDIDWEAHWSDYRFITELECNHKNCKEQVTCAGVVKIYESQGVDEDSGHPLVYESNYYPEYFYPTIRLFELPDYTPPDVETALEIAFKLFWIDKAACVNACRKAVEEIMNDRKVAKTNKLLKPKLKYLSLHERLKIYKTKNPEVAESLLASKWIGNYGSHISYVDNDDALDCLEILFHALQKLYNPEHDRVSKLIKKVNRRKGPVR